MTIDTDRVQALIFDLDGTLADTMPLHLEAWIEIGKEYGLEFTKADHDRLAGMPTEKIIELVSAEQNLQINPHEFVKKKEQYFLDNIDKLDVVNSVMPFAQHFHNNMPMSIGTGGAKNTVRKTINHLALDNYIDITVTCEDVKNHKPAPDTFLKCAELMGIAPENCLVFEDAKMGIKAAQDGGMQYVNITETSDADLSNLLNQLSNE